MKRVWFLCGAVLLIVLGNTRAHSPKISLFSEYGWKGDSSYRTGAQAECGYGSGGFFMEYSQKSGDVFVRNWHFEAANAQKNADLPFLVRLQGGTLLLGGIFSRLNKPPGAVPQPLKTVGAPQTGVIVTAPSFSSGTGKFLSLHSLFSIKSLTFTLTGRIPRDSGEMPFFSGNYAVFASAQYVFPFLPERRSHSNILRGSITLAAGSSRLRSKRENTWYLKEIFFAPTVSRFAAVEGVLQNNAFSLFSSNGFSEHPDGSLRLFSKTEFSVKVSFFTLTGGLTLIDAGYIPLSGSAVHQSVLSWLNPQSDFFLSADGSMRLRLGLLTSVQYEQTAGPAAVPFLFADIKSTAELTIGRFHVKPTFTVKKLDLHPFLRFCTRTQFSAGLLASYCSALYRPLWKISAGIKTEWNVSADFNVTQEDGGIKNKIVPSFQAVITPFTALKCNFNAAFTIKDTMPYSAAAGVGISYVLHLPKQRLEVFASAEFEKKLTAAQVLTFSGECSARLRQ